MSRDAAYTAELHKLCGLMRDGEITDAQAQRLSEILMGSAASRRYYRTFMALASALETRTSLQDAVDLDADSESNIQVLLDMMGQDQDEQASGLFDQPVFAPGGNDKGGNQTLSLREIGGATGYLLTQAVKSRAGSLLAAAAVLLFAATLFIVFGTGDEASRVADGPRPTPQRGGDDGGSSTLSVVATLTDEGEDARWDRRPGQDLYAGQRLTLNQGFAEITTLDGAVAILEAPCTIELTDSGNALRLHEGRLVGVCATPSSQGFVVHTPQLDVTDLGTRFGVDATRPDAVQAHVFEGRVAVSTRVVEGEAQRSEIVAGQAIAVSDTGGLVPASYDPGRFVHDPAIERLRPDFAGTNAFWMGLVTKDLGQGEQQADGLQVFLEQTSLLLDQPVDVDIQPDSDWDPQAEHRPVQLSSGERVDVYLLHFDLLDGHENPEQLVIDFGRPILGVIVTQTTLDATDAALGVPGVNYPSFHSDPSMWGGGHRGLNYNSLYNQPDQASLEYTNDLVSISPDRQRLEMRLWGGRGERFVRMDQVRVIVQTSGDPH